ncbi:MAG: type II toxin-antitoxin system HicA family toxin [Bacteroidales bacterium]|nr:type II toxin-antitoxin system HicA family toxin [Bacteroidales bacterium]
MGTKEKLIERLKRLPTDFTFNEVERLLNLFGYVKSNKGKTSGSRVLFMDGHNRKILLHKPHPGKIVKAYALKEILDKLLRNGDI